MAAVKSKSGMCCSSNFEVNMQKPYKSKMSFNIFDICLVVMSIVTFVVDLSTDIFLVVEYFKHGHTYWALSTFLLIALPAVIVQMFSMRWHIEDETVNKYHWIAHVLLVGLLHRYILVLKTGLEARSSGDVSDFQRLYQQQSDICMLHLFESFMESAPQLVLQLYIMVSLENWQSWTGVSATASLASLAWAVAAYTRAMRRARPDKSHVSWPGLICQAMWRGSMVTARITTLVLFAVGFHAWLFLLVGIHWLSMTVWIVFQKTDFCHTPWEEYVYNCVVGVIYCFCFFNLQEGQSRRRVFAFYVVIISQNFGCLGLFLTLGGATRSGLVEVAISVIVGGTILGVASMLLYYRFFHPAGPIKLCSKDVQQESVTTAPECVSPEKTATIRSLKHRWHTDNHDTLTQLDAVSSQEGSPHSEDTYTDKNLLLTHWISGKTTSPTVKCSAGSTDTLQATDTENTVVSFSDDKEVSHKLENEWPSCETKEALDESIHKHKRRGIYSPENVAFNFVKEGTDIKMQEEFEEENEKLRKQKRRGICSLEPEMEVELEWCADDKGRSPGDECEMEERIRKRRGLCSPDLVGFDIDKGVEVNKHMEGISIGEPVLPSRLSDLRTQEVTVGSFKSSDVQSMEGDEVPSDVLSVPSEVLSAHDYENICAVNIAREAWGLRSWRGYSDIETWLHDDSVVRDRRRDTLTSTTTTLTSTSSERGEAISPPPLPCRKPTIGARALRTRQDDYLDTLADDLAVCDVASEDQTLAEYVTVDSDPNLFVARPYVVDQHGALFPLVMLDTIMEEIEESSISTDNSEPQKQRQCHGSASTLVATIDEIRHGGSVCNLYNSTDVLWDAHSNSSVELQNASNTNASFCCPTETRTPQPYLSPEEVLFLSKLKHTPDKDMGCSNQTSTISNRHPEVILNTSPYTLSHNVNESSVNDIRLGGYEQNGKKFSNRPRRKFSLLREKFEPKQTTPNTDSLNKTVSDNRNELQSSVVDVQGNPKTENSKADFAAINIATSHSESPVCHNKENVTPIVPSRIKHWNNFLKSQNSCNAKLSPEFHKKYPSSAACEIDPNKNIKLASLKERRSLFLKQVLSPPKFQNWGKKSSISPASKAVSA